MDKSLIFKKDGETLYVKTKAENISIDDTNIKDKINKIYSEIDKLKRNSGDISGGGITGEDTTHRELNIASEEGVHNFRFYNNKFSVKEDEEWVDIISKNESSGSGIKLPPTKFIEITSNDTSNTIKWEDADNQTLNGTTIST